MFGNPMDPFGRGTGASSMEDVLSLQTYAQSAAQLAENTGVCCPSKASCNSSTSAVLVPVPVPVDPRPFEPIPDDRDGWTTWA